jgi:hypothetical protein
MKRHHLHISIHAVFAFVWLGAVVVFTRQAVDCHKQASIHLPRYTQRLDAGGMNFINPSGPSFRAVINGIADAHEKSIETLERSIRESAALSRNLNVVSAFMALFGCIAQAGHYWHGREDKNPKPN